MWMASYPFGALADALIGHFGVSVGNVRKLLQGISQFGPAVGFIWLAYVGCDRVLAVVVLCLSVGLNGASFVGFQVRLTASLT